MFENFLKKCLNMWESSVLKTLYTIFSWSKIRFDRSKHTEPSQEILIAISIDRKTQSQAKILWKKDFWKTKQNIAKIPQSIEFCEQNAWIWDEMLFKNTSFEPSFPKIKMFKQFSLNSQASSTFCIKYKEFSNLVGRTKITHNNMHRV